MIARLLYSAVALCVLGARPEHAATRAGSPAAAASAGSDATAPLGPAPGPAPAGGAPADFATPRIGR